MIIINIISYEQHLLSALLQTNNMTNNPFANLASLSRIIPQNNWLSLNFGSTYFSQHSTPISFQYQVKNCSKIEKPLLKSLKEYFL